MIEALMITRYELAKTLGYASHAAIYAVVDGRNNMSPGMMDRIVRTYTNVNYGFLKSGELPILLDKAGAQAQMNSLNIAQPNSDIAALQRIMNIPDQLDRIESKLDKLLGDEKDR
ncbi:hypothetical protein [Flagellimonas nanhaiensis]|uniref:hypothetical protein n=1 Tax=Flagellimonas nanhaiensis TaxID=2292706 RepID=UPI0015F27A3D|nr:hypothetical protein [Allomuricauda nanhaiensis]